MSDQPLDDLFARLERERLEADRNYHDALAAIDRAVGAASTLPEASPTFDGSRLPAINAAWDILPAGGPSLDRSLKGRLRGFIWRLVGRPLDAQRQLNALLVDHLNRTLASQQAASDAFGGLVRALSQELERLAHFGWVVGEYARTVTAYVDTKDRSLGAGELRERLALVEQRVLALKRTAQESPTAAGQAAAATAPEGAVFSGRLDSPAYVGFEDRFRGSQAEISARAHEYLPLLESASDVLDIGCGRGEFLDLLTQRGIRARGVDGNHAMVEVCRARGLAVEQGDALAYLEQQADGSIGAIIAIQVVEHFEPAYLMRFLETAFHKMRPGAPLVLETINAACWSAFFDAYLRDPTHRQALHPDTLKYLVGASGYVGTDIRYRHPVLEENRVPTVAVPPGAPAGVADLAAAINAQADALNARLFSFTDFAVIARR